MISYTYPVMYFYDHDFEESEIIRRKGRIRPIQVKKEPYEAEVLAEGYSFHLIFGSQVNGNFLCIPNWHIGCELAALTDITWNLKAIMGEKESFSYEATNAIAYALGELNKFISD